MRFIIVKILNILSKKLLAKYKPVVIGITGSVGKSSAKKAIVKVLKKKYRIASNKDIYQTDIGIPLAIIGAESGKQSLKQWLKIFFLAVKKIIKKTNYPELLVLEMGVDRPDDMKKMLEVVRPDIGVITNIGKFPPHTKYFRNSKHIAREKFLLVKSLRKKDLAILNCDDALIDNLAKNIKAKTMPCGFGENSVVKAEEILAGDKKWKIKSGSIGMGFKISHQGTTVPFRLPFSLGRGQIYAVLMATAVGIYFKYNLVEISEALVNYQPLPGRMNLIKGAKNSLIIDDTFNSNPDSAASALETLSKLEATRKIAVLGDMLELGEYCEAGHREIGDIVSKSADMLFTYGSRSRIIFARATECGMQKDNVFHFDEIEKLIKFLKNIIKADDVILIKGSRAMHMERVVKEIMAEPELADELLVSL